MRLSLQYLVPSRGAMVAFRLLVALVLGALSVASLSFEARAQSSGSNTAPRLLVQGTTHTRIPGAGVVTLAVLVRKDGTIGAVTVRKSTNRADDTVAIEIARHSTFQPGLRDGRTSDAFYTLELTFGTSAGAHDANGQTSRARLAQLYANSAVEALNVNDNERAIVLAGKAIALQPNANNFYLRGTAYVNAQKYQPAVADLEKAKALQARAAGADSTTANAIDGTLVTAYLFSGQSDKGLALAAALKGRKPSNPRVDETLVAFYNQQSIAALQAGKRDDAVADLENAARAVPARAVALYVQATNILSGGLSPDWKRVKAEADKALAIDPNDASANYVAGIALANQGDRSGAIPYLQKAKANAGPDAALGAQIDSVLKNLNQK
jgi:tetratricopeptide (TPR) repeat protein